MRPLRTLRAIFPFSPILSTLVLSTLRSLLFTRCFLCQQAPPSDVAIKVHPPTVGAAGADEANTGSHRAADPPCSGSSRWPSGSAEVGRSVSVSVPRDGRTVDCQHWAAIATDDYINGRTLSEAMQQLPRMMERTFQAALVARHSLPLPDVSADGITLCRRFVLGVA